MPMSSRISTVIARFKKRPVIIVASLLVAFLAGVSTFISSLDNIIKTAPNLLPRSNSLESDSPEMQALGIATPDTIKEHFRLNETYCPEDGDCTNYTIILRVNVTFKDARFSQKPYLASVSDLDLDYLADHPTYPLLNHSPPEVDKTGIHWWTMLSLGVKPESTDKLKISLGPIFLTLPVRTFGWKAINYESGDTQKVWYRSDAQTTLALDAPTWPLIRSARLLKTSEDKVSLLEIVIENNSKDRPVAITSLRMHASHPPLASGSANSCSESDAEFQNLMLNWGILYSSQGTSGAWTRLSDVDVKVPASFNGKGTCQYFSFDAGIPLSTDVPPVGLRRIVIRVREFPSVKPSSDLLVTSPPRSLDAWEHFEIGLNESKTSAPIYPHLVEVARSVNNSMLLEQEP